MSPTTTPTWLSAEALTAEIERLTMLRERLTHPHRFPETYCSQCGASLGSGNSGLSHCDAHQQLLSGRQLQAALRGRMLQAEKLVCHASTVDDLERVVDDMAEMREMLQRLIDRAERAEAAAELIGKED